MCIYCIVQSAARYFTLQVAPCPGGYELTYESVSGGFTCKYQYYSNIRTCGFDNTVLLLPVRLHVVVVVMIIQFAVV